MKNVVLIFLLVSLLPTILFLIVRSKVFVKGEVKYTFYCILIRKLRKKYYLFVFLDFFLHFSEWKFMDRFYVRLRKSRHGNLCSRNQFFRENVVIMAFSELRPGSNERYENSIYGPFRFLIFFNLIFNKKQFYKSV